MSGTHLRDKVIVVTGAAQGIGAAYAHRLLDEGAAVVLADRDGPAVERIARDRGGLALGFTVDVTDGASIRSFASELGGRFDRLDGLVNNAAIFSTLAMRPFWEIEQQEWDAVLAANLTGPWRLTSALLPLLRSSDGASVVNIGSDAPELGRPGYLHYVASKGGVQAMTYSMAHELGEFGIRVNTISPGPVDTEIPRATVSPAQRDAMLNGQALRRPATPGDVVGTAVYLLGDLSAFVTGQTLSVNGGLIHR